MCFRWMGCGDTWSFIKSEVCKYTVWNIVTCNRLCFSFFCLFYEGKLEQLLDDEKKWHNLTDLHSNFKVHQEDSVSWTIAEDKL